MRETLVYSRVNPWKSHKQIPKVAEKRAESGRLNQRGKGDQIICLYTSKYRVKHGQDGRNIIKPSTVDLAFGNTAHVKGQSDENANHDQGKENAEIQHWPAHPQPRYFW
jgi:hypothetical protein